MADRRHASWEPGQIPGGSPTSATVSVACQAFSSRQAVADGRLIAQSRPIATKAARIPGQKGETGCCWCHMQQHDHSNNKAVATD